MTKIRIAGVVDDSIVDGPGVRYTIFTQGCAHNCKGCHNLHTHNYGGGTLVEIDDLIENIESYTYIKGITFSGGEPLDQPEALKIMIEKLKEKNYHILIFSGYTFEQIKEDQKKFEVVKLVDILIDGKFEIDKMSLDLVFRGSGNQKIIDIPKTLKENKIAILDFDVKY